MNYDLHYLCGYTDGDGCFHIGEFNKKFRNKFIISSTYKRTLEWLSFRFGGKVRFIRRVGNQKPQFHFINDGARAYDFVKTFSDFLIEKKEEAKLFCWFYECIDKKEKQFLIEDMKKYRMQGLAQPQDKLDIEHISLSINPTEFDFAYLAGFIDAECSMSLQRYKRKNESNFIYKVILQCNNTRSQTIRWAVSRFGGNVHFIPRRKYGKNHHNQLTWRMSSKTLSDLLPKIQPFLRNKKAVCDELINFSKTIIPLENSPSRNSDKFKSFYLPIYQQRDIIFQNVRHLNRKGS